MGSGLRPAPLPLDRPRQAVDDRGHLPDIRLCREPRRFVVGLVPEYTDSFQDLCIFGEPSAEAERQGGDHPVMVTIAGRTIAGEPERGVGQLNPAW